MAYCAYENRKRDKLDSAAGERVQRDTDFKDGQREYSLPICMVKDGKRRRFLVDDNSVTQHHQKSHRCTGSPIIHAFISETLLREGLSSEN